MLLDAHTHAHFAAFEGDYKEVIQRALDAGVALINVGTQLDTSRRAVEVAHEFPTGVYASVGLHPIHTDASYHDEKELGGGEAAKSFTSRGEEFDAKAYLELAKDPKVVAIGECGLDYYRLQSANSKAQIAEIKEKQKQVFLQHVEIAKAVNKPLMIHCRPMAGTDDAYEDILDALLAIRPLPFAILHFYVGSVAMTQKFLDAGFNFEFGGVITFSHDYDQQIKMIPLDRLFIETDAPYVAPTPYRGKRNEPAYVVEVAKRMAEIKGVEYGKLVEALGENAKRVFKI